MSSVKSHKKDIKITKENFIKVLSSLDKDQIRDLIESKGKDPKLVSPIVYLN